MIISKDKSGKLEEYLSAEGMEQCPRKRAHHVRSSIAAHNVELEQERVIESARVLKKGKTNGMRPKVEADSHGLSKQL